MKTRARIGLIGAGLGGYLITAIGVQGHAIALTVIALVLLVIAWPRVLADRPHPEEERPKGGLPLTPLPWIIGLMALFSMIPEGAILDWGALYLRNELGASVSQSGFAFAAFSMTMAAMRFAGDLVRDRFGAVTTLRFCSAMSIIGLMIAGLAAYTMARPEAWKRAAATVAACALAMTATPLGLAFWTEIPRSLARIRLYSYDEWQRPELWNLFMAPFWILAATFAAAAIRYRAEMLRRVPAHAPVYLGTLLLLPLALVTVAVGKARQDARIDRIGAAKHEGRSSHVARRLGVRTERFGPSGT